MEKYSISKLNTFNLCNRKYKYQYLDKIGKSGLHLNLVNGSTIHDIIGYYIKQLQEDGSVDISILPKLYLDFFYKNSIKSFFWKYKEDLDWEQSSLYGITNKIENNSLLVDNFYIDYNEMLEQLGTKYSGKSNNSLENEWLLNHEYYNVGIDNYLYLLTQGIEKLVLDIVDLNLECGTDLKVESLFTSNVGKKATLQGFFDLSSYNPDTKVGTIIELKTSGTTVKTLKEEHINQILMYKKLFKDKIKDTYKHNKIKINYYMVYITVLKTQINVNIINVNDIEDDTFNGELKNTISLIDICTKKDIFIAQKGQHCAYCNFKDICLPYIKEEENDNNE